MKSLRWFLRRLKRYKTDIPLRVSTCYICGAREVRFSSIRCESCDQFVCVEDSSRHCEGEECIPCVQDRPLDPVMYNGELVDRETSVPAWVWDRLMEVATW